MGDAELMEKLRSLPLERQEEVYDFIEFLVERCRRSINGTSAIDGRESRNDPQGTDVYFPKRLSEEEIDQLLEKICGAWGPRTLEETEAMIKERRLIDWGENEETP